MGTHRLTIVVRYRMEHDLLGRREVPEDALWGIHTLRATETFRIAGRLVHPAMIHAFGLVKLACARTNHAIGEWPDDRAKSDAIQRAADEMAAGKLDAHIRIDALAGGAGTSLNMNVNEVLANRALQILGEPLGTYSRISPTDDINRHQSTNDTFPTTLKLAAMAQLREVDQSMLLLLQSLRSKERQFADVIKVGRTQLQDAVLTTLGREFSAYAAAIARDRERIARCQHSLRIINLGGTAIGTGLAAPTQYILRVADELASVSGVNVVLAENMVDATQNADVYVEVSGLLKAHAATLIKIATDLRLMSSGPEAGFCEIALPARQAGSSIMPGKVNPVIPETVTQAAMQVIANDAAITLAAASGTLELNPFLPLIADRLLESIDAISRACRDFAILCIDGISVSGRGCHWQAALASTAVATALVSVLGYEKMCDLVKKTKETNLTVRETVLREGSLTAEQFAKLTSPEAICGLRNS